MKIEFAKSFEKLANKDKKVFFLTGDLGFNAFENLKKTLNNRFINAGVAEQNMISVAAGMARMGIKPWVYSIAPFLTLKTVEQVRNDICHLSLPVKLVGNGGGYGYGIMGEAHHVLEDIAIYTSFPNMKIYCPAFIEDIDVIVKKMYKERNPSYLRLNLAPPTTVKLPLYSSVRQVVKGSDITVLVLGYLVHNVIRSITAIGKKNKVDVWSVTELPLKLPDKFFFSLKKSKKLIVIEEHTNMGGLGASLVPHLIKLNIHLKNHIHLYAKGYPSEYYGSHAYHLEENSLSATGIKKNIETLL